MLIAALTFVVANATVAQTPLDSAAVSRSIDDLVATVPADPLDPAAEKPRLGKTATEGALYFFGAPPGRPAPLDAEVAAASAEDKARAFLEEHAAAFGISSENTAFDQMRLSTEANRTYVRLQQTYAGLPVFAGETIVQINDDTGVAAVLSDILRDRKDLDEERVSLTPSVTTRQAGTIAKDSVLEAFAQELEAARGGLTAEDRDLLADLQTDLIPIEGPDLVVFSYEVVGRVGSPVLAWQMTIATASGRPVKEVVLVDAHAGAVVYSYSLVHEGLERAIWDDENHFWNDDVTLVREEYDPPCDIEDADLAYDFIGDTLDFYSDEHGRDTLLCRDADQGNCPSGSEDVTAWVRYCAPIQACAYIFCPCPNAYSDGEKIVFGEGYVVDDVLAHEATHSVTFLESNLIYADESGAINESFSDIWGEFVDLSNGDQGDRWLIGEDLPYGAIRDMQDPPAYYQPDKMSDYDEGEEVHKNCGIGNKLCYLLTDGDTFNGETVTEMGVEAVADLFYECQVHLLTAASDYKSLYYALTQAGINLSLSQGDRANVENACQAVEIDTGSRFVISDPNGDELVIFQSDGDVMLSKGSLLTGQSITPQSNVSEFILRTSQSVLALVDSSTGDFKLKGNLYEEICVVTSVPDDSFVLRDDGVLRAFINSEAYWDLLVSLSQIPAGSLIIEGNVWSSE